MIFQERKWGNPNEIGKKTYSGTGHKTERTGGYVNMKNSKKGGGILVTPESVKYSSKVEWTLTSAEAKMMHGAT